eukprot:9815029-Alexandrium_andersonii.AAC.1
MHHERAPRSRSPPTTSCRTGCSRTSSRRKTLASLVLQEVLCRGSRGATKAHAFIVFACVCPLGFVVVSRQRNHWHANGECAGRAHEHDGTMRNRVVAR